MSLRASEGSMVIASYKDEIASSLRSSQQAWIVGFLRTGLHGFDAEIAGVRGYKLTFMAERPPPPQIVQQELLMQAEEVGKYF